MAETSTKTTNDNQTMAFQAEVQQLLHLVTHSMYSDPEVFLRELISNAADALDKSRYLTTIGKLNAPASELAVHIRIDAEAKTISITDSGIGMSRQDAIDHLGTIAKSGTKAFLKHLNQADKQQTEQIGQFGVGFYSSFIVADRVDVFSRRFDCDSQQAVHWSSSGDGQFSVEPCDRADYGTEVVLHLRSEHHDFLTPERLKNIVLRYADHISFPVYLAEPAKESDQGETWQRINQASALWQRPKKDISENEYQEFFQRILFGKALTWVHKKVEGRLEYTLLLAIPEQPPFDLFQKDGQRGVKLYVQRVFITDQAESFLPNYLRFVRGVVDSNDLPLNVSRELLQSSQVVDKIKGACSKAIIDTLTELATQDKTKYQLFWRHFGSVLKEGPAEDPSSLSALQHLFRFASTYLNTEEQNTSLADYVRRMKENQKEIYFLIAESFATAKNSPQLEVFRKHGIEVLLLTDRIDEWLVGYLTEFEDKKLVDIARGELDLGDIAEELKSAQQTENTEYQGFIDQMKKQLPEVTDVRMTARLTESPACIVMDPHQMNRSMQRMLQMAGQSVPPSKPILELNGQHALVKHAMRITSEAEINQWAHFFLDQALLASGESLEDPASFVHRINDMLYRVTLIG